MRDKIGRNDQQNQSLDMIWEKTSPVVSVVGYSGSGKTTLLEKLISELAQRGYAVGTIKHNVHGFEMDKPGKDSWRHKKAGASATIISSPFQIGMVRDVEHDHSPEELMALLPDMDIVLTEGYKKESLPKLEVFRSEVHKAPLFKGDKSLLALISDDPIDLGVSRFSPGDVQKLVDFLIRHFNLAKTIPVAHTKAAS